MASPQENITFGSEYDEARYKASKSCGPGMIRSPVLTLVNTALNQCALDRDLELFSVSTLELYPLLGVFNVFNVFDSSSLGW